MDFNWNIPNTNQQTEPYSVHISTGTVIFIVGANGSGKSALITHLTKASNNTPLTRISAHRQSWLGSNSIDITQKARNQHQQQIQNQDKQDTSRWKDDLANQRAQISLFDLANSENSASRIIADLLRGGQSEKANAEAAKPSPIAEINNILNISALSVRLSLSEDGDLMAQHVGGDQKFSITEMSDG